MSHKFADFMTVVRREQRPALRTRRPEGWVERGDPPSPSL
jgi:hypothetical protein